MHAHADPVEAHPVEDAHRLVVLGRQRDVKGFGHDEHDLEVGDHELGLGDEPERYGRKARGRDRLPPDASELQEEPRRARDPERNAQRQHECGGARRPARLAPRRRSVEVVIRRHAHAAERPLQARSAVGRAAATDARRRVGRPPVGLARPDVERSESRQWLRVRGRVARVLPGPSHAVPSGQSAHSSPVS